jgi:hypothetical protein
MISVSTKDPHSLSYRQKMEGYSEVILHKIGPREREVIVIMEMQMIRLGYFLFTIKLNSKLNSNKNNMR